MRYKGEGDSETQGGGDSEIQVGGGVRDIYIKITVVNHESACRCVYDIIRIIIIKGGGVLRYVKENVTSRQIQTMSGV